MAAGLLAVAKGSSDGTVAACEECVRGFPFTLRVARESKPRASAARNRDVAEACGRLILSANNATTPERDDLIMCARSPSAADPGRDPGQQSLRGGSDCWRSVHGLARERPSKDSIRLDAGLGPAVNHRYARGIAYARGAYLRLIQHYRYTPSQWRRRGMRVGAEVARLNDSRPPAGSLAPIPGELRWQAMAIADALLEGVNRDLRRVLAQVRTAAYAVTHGGADARGYRSEITQSL